MSSTPAERRALAVVAAIAALGVVARIVKSRHARPVPTAAEVLALDAQIARVQSARGAGRRAGGPARATRTGAAGESRTTRPSSQSAREVMPRPPVDLDTASAATIESLPWIGPSLAARIVESRERCGPFGSMEALTRVYGIGEGMSRRLAPHVTFSTPSRPKDAERAPACSASAKGAAPHRKGRS
ncbi:MAG TPA: helix-hairpin-helix domain-containing protein [Gemmatimonadaceae bacterium]